MDPSQRFVDRTCVTSRVVQEEKSVARRNERKVGKNENRVGNALSGVVAALRRYGTGTQRQSEEVLRIAAEASEPGEEVAVAAENFVKHAHEAPLGADHVDKKNDREYRTRKEVRAQCCARRVGSRTQDPMEIPERPSAIQAVALRKWVSWSLVVKRRIKVVCISANLLKVRAQPQPVCFGASRRKFFRFAARNESWVGARDALRPACFRSRHDHDQLYNEASLPVVMQYKRMFPSVPSVLEPSEKGGNTC